MATLASREQGEELQQGKYMATKTIGVFAPSESKVKGDIKQASQTTYYVSCDESWGEYQDNEYAERGTASGSGSIIFSVVS